MTPSTVMDVEFYIPLHSAHFVSEIDKGGITALLKHPTEMKVVHIHPQPLPFQPNSIFCLKINVKLFSLLAQLLLRDSRASFI